jgi:predicted nucleotidyltransferase component of viral defense system
MQEPIKQMLQRYPLQSQNDIIQALKEIIQEIALLGLWRSKFFEKAAFYGGTALRLLYNLDRFSEDLDFSLLPINTNLNLTPYYRAIQEELQSFGLAAQVEPKIKQQGNIQSAFIKIAIKQQLASFAESQNISQNIHKDALIKIKVEVDVNPPGNFKTQCKTIFQPIPFSVLTFQPADLFATKLHAIICRAWKTRIKGRDWYDLIWFISQDIPVRLAHLCERLRHSQHWPKEAPFNRTDLLNLLEQRITEVDFELAKQDVLPFVCNQAPIDLWSKDFFKQIIARIQVINV